jgi:hypothetical protein
MSKIDELKEKISLASKIFFVLGGLIVIVIGGIVNLYLENKINEIFWLGIGIVPTLVLLIFIVFAHIRKYIEEIGKL